jgi:hypothetical protein
MVDDCPTDRDRHSPTSTVKAAFLGALPHLLAPLHRRSLEHERALPCECPSSQKVSDPTPTLTVKSQLAGQVILAK